MKKNNLLYLVPVVLFIISTLVSRQVFSRSASQPRVAENVEFAPMPEEQETDSSLLNIEPTEPRDQVCPLNGDYFTATEKASWEKRRPLAVMIENTPEARPQSGLTSADIVFEAVAEGGITRFMAMYYCDAQDEEITLAPIRSARTYYILLASGFNRPLYVHVGGANLEGPANALGQLSDYGWTGENDINQFSVGYPTFIRDYNRIPGVDIATEHTMTTSTEKLWAVGVKRGWTNMSPDTKVKGKTVAGEDWSEGYTGWSFEDGESKANSQTVSYSFWSGQPTYDVTWKYDAASNTYKREQGGSAHTDLENGQQIAVSDVIVMFANEEGPIDDKKHLLYELVGKGTGLLFTNGQATEINWSKKTRESEIVFTDSKNKDIALTRGKIWVSIVPTGNKVSY